MVVFGEIIIVLVLILDIVAFEVGHLDFIACLIIGVEFVSLFGVSKVISAIGCASAIVSGNVNFLFFTDTGI